MPLTAVLRDLNKLNTFVRVAQRRELYQSGRRAAHNAIGRQQADEGAGGLLGFSLLNRSTHGLVLTDAGEGLFQQCLEMLAKLDTYVTETRNIETGPFGTLRVQATSGYARSVLAPLAARFVQKRQGVRVHLAVVPENVISAEDGFDVIVSSQKPSLPGLVAHDLGPIRHVICGSPGYFRKLGRPRRRRICEPTTVSPTCIRAQRAGRFEIPPGRSSSRSRDRCRPTAMPSSFRWRSTTAGSSGCRSMP